MLRTHSLRGQGSLSLNAQSVPVVRVALAEDAPAKDTTGLSSGALAGIVVGSVLGGVVLIFLIGFLILCLCQRRKVSSDQTKPGTNSAPKLSASSSAWNCFRKRNVAGSRGRRTPPPIFGSDKQDPDDISDTSFVLPELGGPNPHNKFDGMEWVDIKGLDDEHLQDISTDLRKYQQGQQRRY